MKNRKRKTAYLIIITICLAAVAIHIQEVKAARSKPIVTFYNEWKKVGKPVEVQVIAAKDVPVHTQFTVRMVDGRMARGFVTGDIKNVLREDQEIYDSTDTAIVCARLKSVGTELDLDAGMFPVEVAFEKSRNREEVLVVSAHTTTLYNALTLPNEVLDIVAGEYSVWKDENGMAKKYRVKIGSRNGYGAVITGGLQSGDRVVFRGQSLLSDNDKLLVVNDTGADKEGKVQ